MGWPTFSPHRDHGRSSTDTQYRDIDPPYAPNSTYLHSGHSMYIWVIAEIGKDPSSSSSSEISLQTLFRDWRTAAPFHPGPPPKRTPMTPMTSK